MRRGVKGIGVMVVASCLAACAQLPGKAPPVTYTFQVADGTITLRWNCGKTERGALQVAGTAAHSTAAGFVKDVQTTVVGLDAKDKTVTTGSGYTLDYRIAATEPSRFFVTLALASTAVRYDLQYRYWYESEGGKVGGVPAEEHRDTKTDACPAVQPASAP